MYVSVCVSVCVHFGYYGFFSESTNSFQSATHYPMLSIRFYYVLQYMLYYTIIPFHVQIK